MRPSFLSLIACTALLIGCGKQTPIELPPLIPIPQALEQADESPYTPEAGQTISLPEETPILSVLATEINASLSEAGLSPLEVCTGQSSSRGITLSYSSEAGLPRGGYTLSVHKSGGVQIQAADAEGLIYGTQTLRQLITPQGIPSVEIHDEPRFGYRGVMLDVSRHFVPVEFIEKLIDELQRYKFNRFHLHLVDAAGWRLQLDKYPELTKKAAFRTESDWTKWWIENDRRYLDEGTPGAYGGYYTKEDMRRIIRYAADRGITIIPEIEMPGHSEEVLYTYPELCCDGSPRKGQSDFCIGNPKTIEFLTGVLDEVIELFPSEYIHIGGDEAGKTAWKTCPKCRALMKKEGMKSIDELQSYLIHQIAEYLGTKGRKMIGWDEIMEGGLAPDAIVMSWRGEKGGIEAAKLQHQVIMTPNSHLYFDYYQEDPLRAGAKGFGGFIPLSRVYSYDPVPKELSKDEQKFIIGVQGNLWTEFVPDEAQVGYMLFPRALALAEVAWSSPERKSWEDFRIRANKHIPLLHKRGINAYDLSTTLVVADSVDYERQTALISMKSERYPYTIRYRLDGQVPTAADAEYHEAEYIETKDSADLVAALFEGEQMLGSPTRFRTDYHKGVGKRVSWQSPIGGGYPAGGIETALLDGYRGSSTYMDGRWLGNIADQNTIGTIDLGEPTVLTHVSTKCMHDLGPWVQMPEWVELAVSDDGKHYTVVSRERSKTDPKDQELRFETFHFYPDTTARYLRIHYHLPVKDKFLFTDEIVIW